MHWSSSIESPRQAGLLSAALALGLVLLSSHADAQGRTLQPSAQLQLPTTPGFFPAPMTTPITGNSAEFSILDSIEGTNVDFVLSSMDGMALDSSGRLFVVNPYHGKIVRFDDLTQGTPSLSIDAAVGPVGLATWVSPVDGHEELLAISRSSYALTVFDPDSGELLDLLQLPAEPAHLLVVDDTLYVSCSADNIVVAIDLVNRTEITRYELDGAIAYSRLFESNGLIYITAQHSGNNSVVFRGLPTLQFAAVFTFFDQMLGQFLSIPVLDLDDPVLASSGLPDEDVMCINPATQSVSVALSNVGTTLAAGAVHPTTGAAWILNMEANNKDADLQSEPLVNGNFIFNRITISSLGGNGSPAVVAGAAPGDSFVSLDDMGLGGSEPQSVGHPYDLCFDSAGNAYVIGLLSDNVVRLDSAGVPNAVWRLDGLEEGRIPRDLILIEEDNLLLVYCWGTNDVAALDLAAGSVLPGSLDLGYDPTSALRKTGRALFFDGDNSELNNSSCASCHIEGVQDFVAWDISDLPEDNKGPLQTQNLRGIKPLNPYHWRGERPTLVDFNVAFPGLLGGEELDEPAFDAFEAFVFGMQEPANPRTHPSRLVVDSEPGTLVNFNVRGDLVSPSLSAVNGQSVYLTVPNVGPSTCQDCHALPTGTTNDFFHDDLRDQDHRSSFDVPAYNGMWRKEQKSRQTLTYGSGAIAEERPPLGVGSSHAGNFSGVYEFIVDQFGPLTNPNGNNPNSTRQDVALFVHQIDSGIAPAVHQAALLDVQHTAAEDFVKFLRDQARAGNCDLACFGTITQGGVTSKLRWFYNVRSDRFVPEDSSLPSRPLNFFINKAANGTASNLFVGLPRGMGRRWAIDYDDDGLLNLDEAAHGTSPFRPDSDRDSYLDGVEVAGGSLPNDSMSTPSDDGTDPRFMRLEPIYHTARVAKYIVESDEYATLRVDYTLGGVSAPGSPLLFDKPARHFSVLVRDMLPSYPTTGASFQLQASFTLTDRFGNSKLQAAAPLTPLDFILATEQNDPQNPIEETVLGRLEFASQAPAAGGGQRLVFNAQVLHQKDLVTPALANETVVARVLKRAPGETVFTPSTAFTIEVSGTSMSAPQFIVDELAGLISPTQPDGSNFPPGIDGSAFPLGQIYPANGPFAVSTPTDANGDCTLTLVITEPAGTEVYLSVETAGLVNPATYLAVPGFVELGGAFHFPATAAEHRTTRVDGVGVILN